MGHLVKVCITHFRSWQKSLLWVTPHSSDLSTKCVYLALAREASRFMEVGLCANSHHLWKLRRAQKGGKVIGPLPSRLVAGFWHFSMIFRTFINEITHL